MKTIHVLSRFIFVALFPVLSSCAVLRAVNNTESGAAGEAAIVWSRWIDSEGDIAAATTWQRKVKEGVSIIEVEQAFASVAAEYNIKAVGEMALSEELEARSGQRQKFLKVYSYCSPTAARAMVDFSSHMAAFLPCRISLVEREDGLWIYTLNMDMLIKMGRKLPPDLKEKVMQVREVIWQMLEKGSKGEF